VTESESTECEEMKVN